MKVAPVSADLLIKLALAAAVIGVGVWAVRRTTSAISGAIPDVGGWIDDASSRLGVVMDSLGAGVTSFSERWGVNHAQPLPNIDNPWGITLTPEQQRVQQEIANRPNPIYRGVNAIGSGITGDGNFTLGGYLYDLLNPTPPWATPPYVPIGEGAQDARRIDRALGY